MQNDSVQNDSVQNDSVQNDSVHRKMMRTEKGRLPCTGRRPSSYV